MSTRTEWVNAADVEADLVHEHTDERGVSLTPGSVALALDEVVIEGTHAELQALLTRLRILVTVDQPHPLGDVMQAATVFEAMNADVLTDLVTDRDAHAVLFHYGPRGLVMEPGGFTRSLVEALVRADPQNRARLASTFPGLAAAVQLVDRHPDGIDRLRAIAGLAPLQPGDDDGRIG